MSVPFSIEACDIEVDEHVAAFHAVDTALDREALPDHPVMPLEQYALQVRYRPSFRTARRWMARVGGDVVGIASASWNDTDDNRSHASVYAGVLAGHRRRGIGRELLAAAVASLPEDRTIIDTDARLDHEGEHLLRAIGAVRRHVGRRSICPLTEDVRPLLEGWVARAKERAGGYSAVVWDGPCPDELIDAFVHAKHVMNTAPLEQLDRDDDVWTVERLREYERVFQARGLDWWTVAVRHDESGQIAGYTELHFPRRWPQYAYQEDTGVWPEHRERGLGRWLKAASALRALDERPEVELIETWNAGSNEPMLNINVAMGFRPLEYWGDWQVPTETARVRLQQMAGGRP